MRSAYKIRVRKPEGKRPPGRQYQNGSEKNRVGRCGLDWSGSE